MRYCLSVAHRERIHSRTSVQLHRGGELEGVPGTRPEPPQPQSDTIHVALVFLSLCLQHLKRRSF